MPRPNRPNQNPRPNNQPPSQLQQSDDQVPMMFRAQIVPRCSLQKTDKEKYVERWVNEWRASLGVAPPMNDRGGNRNIQRGRSQNTASNRPSFGQGVVRKPYTLAWRLITNSGADPSINHPTFGSQGRPFFTGSSMKGAFLRALKTIYKDDEVAFQEKRAYYCGRPPTTDNPENKDNGSPSSLGLRFHGGYPVGDEWAHRMIDLVHPQEGKQVTGIAKDNEGLKFQITLQDCKMEFGLSSPILAQDSPEWQEIWEIWEKALEQGLGSRTSAGYGFFENQSSEKPLVTAHLEGIGLASKLQDEKLRNIKRDIEFRPNIFKAALRGHTLRLFAGMTDEPNARQLTELLWGGLNSTQTEGDRRPIVGLLRADFEEQACDVQYEDREAVYEVEGSLKIFSTNPKYEHLTELQTIAKQIVQFAMMFGGFGKSWRRTDHSLFFPNYGKHAIGCYWEFVEESKKLCLPIQGTDLSPVTNFINELRKNLETWAKLEKKTIKGQPVRNWRESWFQGGNNTSGVEVWGRVTQRVAEDELDEATVAIRWLHNPAVKKKLGGAMRKTGSLWHRMYPYSVEVDRSGDKFYRHIEFLTIFPSTEYQDSYQFLEEQMTQSKTQFTRIW